MIRRLLGGSLGALAGLALCPTLLYYYVLSKVQDHLYNLNSADKNLRSQYYY